MAALVLMTGCASAPEYKMVPTADHGVGVRFAKGDAMMVSSGRLGSVMLFPVRYNNSNKLYFLVGAFNLSRDPINFGAEDVRVRLDNGEYLGVQDFDYLREEAKRNAQRELAAAWVSAGIDGVLAYQDHKESPDRFDTAYRTTTGELFASQAVIEARLLRAVRDRGRVVLQTTTIDPGSTFGGAIFTQQISIPQGAARTIDVQVNLGGEPHAFRIAMAPSGTPTPVAMGIPAVPAREVRAIQEAQPTWMWDGPLPPSQQQVIY